jgi:hypothetical protein
MIGKERAYNQVIEWWEKNSHFKTPPQTGQDLLEVIAIFQQTLRLESTGIVVALPALRYAATDASAPFLAQGTFLRIWEIL